MDKEVIFGHSPDSDDAFMYYGIASGNVKLDNYKISHLMEDIESLNIRSEKGELDVTAISVAHYPKIMDKYQIMNCGSSVGRNYGPILVSKCPASAVITLPKPIREFNNSLKSRSFALKLGVAEFAIFDARISFL